jgi:hypothetical protein
MVMGFTMRDGGDGRMGDGGWEMGEFGKEGFWGGAQLVVFRTLAAGNVHAAPIHPVIISSLFLPVLRNGGC